MGNFSYTWEYDNPENYISSSNNFLFSGSEVITKTKIERFAWETTEVSGAQISVGSTATEPQKICRRNDTWTVCFWAYIPSKVPTSGRWFFSVGGELFHLYQSGPFNSWFHYTLRKNSTSNYTTTEFINKIKADHGDRSAFGETFLIGANTPASTPGETHFFKVDRILFFNRALTDGEIGGLVDKNFTGSFNPVYTWDFEPTTSTFSQAGANESITFATNSAASSSIPTTYFKANAGGGTYVGEYRFRDPYYPITEYYTGSFYFYNKEALSLPIFTTLNSISASFTGSIEYQISRDGNLWEYWNGSSWTSASSADRNTEGEISDNISDYRTREIRTIYIKAFLTGSSAFTQSMIDNLTLNYSTSDRNVFSNMRIKNV